MKWQRTTFGHNNNTDKLNTMQCDLIQESKTSIIIIIKFNREKLTLTF